MEPIRFLWNTLKSHASYVGHGYKRSCFCFSSYDNPRFNSSSSKSTRKQQFHFIQSRKTEKKVNNLIHSNVTNGRKFR
uniref:Uncharacterized protein n=1 Tax=Populus trichocarpa TaxID=3694 RepID=A0A2K2A2G8_POPTR